MLDRFQNLPTPARIALLLIGVGLLVAFIALLAQLAPSDSGGTVEETPASSSPAPTTQSTPSQVPSFDPNSLGPDERQNSTPAPGDPLGAGAKYSSTQLNQAAGIAGAALSANCRYTADQSADSWVDDQRRYWTKAAFAYDEQDRISFVKAQQCKITNAEAKTINADGSVEVSLAAEQGATYQVGAPLVGGGKADANSYLYYIGGTATVVLQGGKWLVTSLDYEQQGS